MSPRKSFVDYENKLKECTKCGAVMALEFFAKDARGVLQRKAQCRECSRIEGVQPRVFIDLSKGTKECTKCKLMLPLDSFDKNGKRKLGIRSDCKSCISARRKARYQTSPPRRDPEKRRATLKRARVKQYGLTVEQYDAMLAAQCGECCICKKIIEKPYVDHNHTTGRVRGLLCMKCNAGLGMLGDSVDRVDAAAAYLRLHS